MSISSISNLQKSYYISADMTKEQINDRLEEAMINLDFDQMIELLNQGANPHITTVLTSSLAEKIFNYTLEKVYFREREVRDLLEKDEEECSADELEIIKALQSDIASVSDEQLKDYLRSTPRFAHCGPITLVQIAFSCLHVALIQKLDELDLLPIGTDLPEETGKLFFSKSGFEVIKMLLSQGYSLSELLFGEEGTSIQEIYKNFNFFAFYGYLKCSMMDFYLFFSEIDLDLEDYFEDEQRLKTHLNFFYHNANEEKTFEYIDFFLNYSGRYFESHKEDSLYLSFDKDDEFVENQFQVIQKLIAKKISLSKIFRPIEPAYTEYLDDLKLVAQLHGDTEILKLIEIENQREDICYFEFYKGNYYAEKAYQIIRNRLSNGASLKDVVFVKESSLINLKEKAQELNDLDMLNLLEIESHKKENFNLCFEFDSPHAKESYDYFRGCFLHGTPLREMLSKIETCYQWEVANLRMMAQKLNDQEMLNLLAKQA